MPWDLALGTSFFMFMLRLCSFLALFAGSPLEGWPAGTRLLARAMPGQCLSMGVSCTLMVPPRLCPSAYIAFVAMMQAITSGSHIFLIPERTCLSCSHMLDFQQQLHGVASAPAGSRTGARLLFRSTSVVAHVLGMFNSCLHNFIFSAGYFYYKAFWNGECFSAEPVTMKCCFRKSDLYLGTSVFKH